MAKLHFTTTATSEALFVDWRWSQHFSDRLFWSQLLHIFLISDVFAGTWLSHHRISLSKLVQQFQKQIFVHVSFLIAG